MTYKELPVVGGMALPALEWRPTTACGSRAGAQIEDVFVHRWGIADWRHERIDGVLNEFLNPACQASAHFVYAGEVGPDAGRCVQMVQLADKAWTEAADNPKGVSIECGDGIWLGGDPRGFARTARIVAWLLRHEQLPAAWVRDPHGTHEHGFSRHADGGAADGGHTVCPTADLELWGQFVGRVKAELAHGGFRDVWAR